MPTEHISPRFVDLDSWSTSDIVDAMYEGQLAAAAAVRAALPAISAAVDDAVPALERGGRLVYVGRRHVGPDRRAGRHRTASDLQLASDRLVFVMAGGMDALLRSSEGAEDRSEDGSRAIADAMINRQRRGDRCRGQRHHTFHGRRVAVRAKNAAP